MRVRKPKSKQPFVNTAWMSSNNTPYTKQNKFVRVLLVHHKLIILLSTFVAILALFALVFSLLTPSLPTHVLPIHQSRRDSPAQAQPQMPPMPSNKQPLTKNTGNLVGLDQNILCVSDDAGNNIYGLQQDSGKIAWQYHEAHSTLETVYDNKRLYLSEQNGANATIRVLSLNDGKLLWQHVFTGLNIASLAVENSALYITAQNNVLYVLSDNDGKLLWQFTFPPNTSYTQADGVTLAYTEDGRSIWDLQTSDGKLLWHSTEHTSSWPLTASAGITFLQTQDGYLKALHSQNGRQFWQSTIATVADNPVKVVNAIAYINTDIGTIKAVRITDGHILWQYKPINPIQGEVTLNGNMLYATSLDNTLYALDARSGVLRWQKNIHALSNGLVLAGSVVYVHNSSGSEYAFNATNGALLWSRNLPQTTIDRTIVLSDKHTLYIVGADKTLTAINSDTGKLLWQQHIRNYPLFGGTNVYVNGGDGNIDALDSHAGTVLWYVAVSR